MLCVVEYFAKSVAQGHWKWTRGFTVSYSHSVATVALPLTVSTQYTKVTDTLPSTVWQHRPRLCLTSRGKSQLWAYISSFVVSTRKRSAPSAWQCEEVWIATPGSSRRPENCGTMWCLLKAWLATDTCTGTLVFSSVATKSGMVIFNSFFIARKHTGARYWYSKSVCLSVCLSVRPSLTFRYHMKRLLTYCHSFFHHTVL